MSDFAVGDEVRVFDVNAARVGQPDGGWIGTVVKVGRVLMTVSFRVGTWQDEQVFRIEDGSWNNREYGHHRWVRTLAQVETSRRREVAVDRLKAHGLTLAVGCPLTVDQIEALAAALPADA